MSLIVAGRLPWSPSPDARDLDVWYTYEYPYVGTFTVNGVTVLFNVLGGVETEMTVWAYTCLGPDEADALAEASFASLSDLRQFVQETLTGRQLVFALADDLLISSWAVSEDKGELYEVATLVIAHEDRLARFGFDYLEHAAARNGCTILIANQESLSPREEMVQDLLSIVHAFSCRLHGLRRYEKALKDELADVGR